MALASPQGKALAQAPCSHLLPTCSACSASVVVVPAIAAPCSATQQKRRCKQGERRQKRRRKQGERRPLCKKLEDDSGSDSDREGLRIMMRVRQTEAGKHKTRLARCRVTGPTRWDLFLKSGAAVAT